MAEQRLEHIFDCDADAYWGTVFFEEEFNRRLFIETLRFDKWQVLEDEDGERSRRRVVDAIPEPADLPGPLKKIAKNGVGYREESTYDKQTQRLLAKVTPTSMPDKIKITSEVRSEPLSAGKFKRIVINRVEASIFGVGGMIEKRILDDMKKSYDEGARFTARYIAEKGLGGA